MKRIPKRLQPLLWSTRVSTLDPVRDRPYVVHQVLRYGTLRDLQWLKKAYPRRTLHNTFLQHPLKIYSPSALNFAAKYILRINPRRLDENRYLTSAPRRAPRRRARAAAQSR